MKTRFLLPLLLIAAPLIQGCWHSVEAGHIGVKTEFGEIQDEPKAEGFHWYSPFGSDIHDISTRIQKMELTASASSKDLQVVTTKLALNFRLDSKHVVNIFRDIGNLESVESTIIDPAIQEAIKQSTALFTAAQLVTQRTEAKAAITDAVKTTLAKSHILVTEVSITNFAFDKKYQHAVEAKQIAEQKAQQATNDLARIKVEAEQVAAKADGKAKAMLVVAKAEAEAQALLRKTLTPEIIYLRAIEKWDGHQPQIVGQGGAIVDFAAFAPKKGK